LEEFRDFTKDEHSQLEATTLPAKAISPAERLFPVEPFILTYGSTLLTS
jgi:hypothetical protein